ncbi:hypothetical protein [Lactovum odontotermitis]
MATKKEWTEFFELMNGSKPTVEEFSAAVKNGEVENEVTPEVEVLSPKNSKLQMSSYDLIRQNPQMVHAEQKGSGSGCMAFIGIVTIIVGILLWYWRTSMYSSLNAGQSIRNFGIILCGIILVVGGIINSSKKK